MLRQWQDKRPVRAKIQGKWYQFQNFEHLTNGSIRVQLGGQELIVPAGSWKEMTQPKVDDAAVASGQPGQGSSQVDLNALKPGAPKPRTRLKKDGVPPEQVLVAFIGVGAVVLVVLILAAVMNRF